MVNVSFCRLGRLLPAPFAGYVLPYVRRALARAEPDKAYTVLGAMWNGLACGVAVVEWGADSGTLQSFFVDPKARGCGVGGHMLDLLLEDGARQGKRRLFLAYILRDDELAAMDALVRSSGGTIGTGAPVCGMHSGDFLGSPLLGPALRPGWQRPEQVSLFSELSPPQRALLEERCAVLPEFLRPAALGERLDPALSCAWLTDGVPTGFALGFQSGDRMFCQSSIWRGPDAPEGSFRALICTQVNRCWYRSGGDFVFFVSPINPRAATIAEWFTGGNYEPYSQREAEIPIPAPA